MTYELKAKIMEHCEDQVVQEAEAFLELISKCPQWISLPDDEDLVNDDNIDAIHEYLVNGIIYTMARNRGFEI